MRPICYPALQFPFEKYLILTIYSIFFLKKQQLKIIYFKENMRDILSVLD